MRIDSCPQNGKRIGKDRAVVGLVKLGYRDLLAEANLRCLSLRKFELPEYSGS
jgi:hypothetical protein